MVSRSSKTTGKEKAHKKVKNALIQSENATFFSDPAMQWLKEHCGEVSYNFEEKKGKRTWTFFRNKTKEVLGKGSTLTEAMENARKKWEESK